jgi:nitrogen fixation-related uncharacterized protein
MQENKNNENESLAMYLVKEYAKQAKRLFILLIISIIANILIVGAFLLYNSQYDYTDYEIQQDGQGINNYIGGDGDNINGSTDSQANANEEER